MTRLIVLIFLLAFPGAPWRAAPVYEELFAPSGPRHSAYRTYVSELPITALLQQLRDDPERLTPPGAWASRPAAPLDAFGRTGRFDAWKLLRLYGAQRVQVARGPRGPGGVTTESWTLISPYPDPTLDRLEPGTLLIVLSLNPS